MRAKKKRKKKKELYIQFQSLLNFINRLQFWKHESNTGKDRKWAEKCGKTRKHAPGFLTTTGSKTQLQSLPPQPSPHGLAFLCRITIFAETYTFLCELCKAVFDNSEFWETQSKAVGECAFCLETFTETHFWRRTCEKIQEFRICLMNYKWQMENCNISTRKKR